MTLMPQALVTVAFAGLWDLGGARYHNNMKAHFCMGGSHSIIARYGEVHKFP